MEGAKGRRALRCRRPARDASPKKVEGVQFLDLQMCRIDCLLGHRENVLPKMNFRLHREIPCSSRFAGRHFHNHRLILNKIKPSGLISSNSSGFSRMGISDDRSPRRRWRRGKVFRPAPACNDQGGDGRAKVVETAVLQTGSRCLAKKS
jgi:hypothetical protein